MSKTRVLVVDDDADILALLKYNLEKEDLKVRTVEDSREAIREALSFSPDLIILDIMMPHINGLELCRQLRRIEKFQDAYIFFLTARSEVQLQDPALDAGADDFIEKIVGLRVLTNRVVSVLKRHFVIRKSSGQVQVGELQVNRAKSLAVLSGEKIPLARPELDLLFFLAQNPRKVITRDNLVGNIWGSEIYSSSLSVDTYLEKLSQKLGVGWIMRLSEDKYKFIPH
ncbi:MAG: response regulator transcription factor [Cyclobacteriaceae bacterium]|jgi:two-component system alkaline phosphatase synthesis response regulator PhoP